MTQITSLDLQRFEELLDVHGAELERWPDPVREPALRLLQSSDAARSARARAERLGRLLDAVPEVVPSAQLRARVAAIPLRLPRQRFAVRWWPFGNPLAPLFAWGAAAALGLLVGNGALGDGLFDARAPSEQVETPIGAADPNTPAVSEASAEAGDDLSDVSDLMLGNLVPSTGTGWEEE